MKYQGELSLIVKHHFFCEKVLGKVGKIVRITPKKDVVVSFGKKLLVFNIACLRPCPGAEVDQIEEEEDLTLSVGKINIRVPELLRLTNVGRLQ